ncbi:unnamed protein product, partial [Adineta steineri]
MDVLRGRYQKLPEVRSKVVRVFISSTFSDTLSERDSLIDTVFPKLKDYCREKYGLEFQVLLSHRYGSRPTAATIPA